MFGTSDILKCTDDWMFIGMQDRWKLKPDSKYGLWFVLPMYTNHTNMYST